MTTTTDDTFTTPAGEVTDHDPTGVQWVSAAVTADELPEELLDECAFEDGQTHRTVLGLNEWEADDVEDGAPTHGSRAAALRATSDVDGTPDDYWSIYALVPAQVRGEPRPAGDPWADLMCALALAAGRPGSNGARPFWYSRVALHLAADPYDFTDAEIEQLRAWGFAADGHGSFSAIRFGGTA